MRSVIYRRGSVNGWWRAILLCGTLATCAWPQAQTPEKQKANGQGISRIEAIPLTGNTVSLSDPEFTADLSLGIGLYVVKNRPFCARLIVQVDKRLGDGNMIRRESAGNICRDSRGRVRQERPKASGVPDVAPVISITDRTSGLFYQLLPKSMRAVKLTVPPEFETGDHAEGWPMQSAPGQSEVSVESIGYQMMEGAQVKGSRITRSTPVGVAGNTFPIEVITERWYSEELQVSLLVKITDSGSGETMLRLEDVSREEPAASLYEIPPDYQIQEEKMTPLAAPRKSPER